MVFSLINAVVLSLATQGITRDTVTPDMILDYLKDDQDDLNFRNVRSVFYALNALELMFSAESMDDVDGGQPGMDRFDAGRRFLLPLFIALGNFERAYHDLFSIPERVS